jgi:hypothetical protein
MHWGRKGVGAVATGYDTTERFGEEVAAGAAFDLDDVDLEGLPSDLVDDIVAEQLLHRNLIGEASPEDECGDQGLDEVEASSGDEAEIMVQAAVPPLVLVRDVAAAAAMSPLGYITSPIGVWAGRAMVGRLTTWPAHKPVSNRSVSMKCYLHPGCTTPARARWKVSDDRLLLWLFSGVAPEEGASAAKKQELKAAHLTLFAKIVESKSPSSDAAPSATDVVHSGAASSAGPA